VEKSQGCDALEEEIDDLRAQLERQASEINRIRNLPEQCDIEQISAESAERFERINEQARLIEKLRNLPGRADELDRENQELYDRVVGLELVLQDQDFELHRAAEVIRLLAGFQKEAVAELLLLIRSIGVAYQKLDNCAEESDELRLWRSGQYRIVDPPMIDRSAQAGRKYGSGIIPGNGLPHKDEPGVGDTILGLPKMVSENPSVQMARPVRLGTG
jgi:predicted nuclease with TOPRIM domain